MANANKPIDGNGLLYIWNKFMAKLTEKLTGKVDKEDGKGLSANDLTDTLKSNYDAAYNHSQSAHAVADAEKNTVVGVQKTALI